MDLYKFILIFYTNLTLSQVNPLDNVFYDLSNDEDIYKSEILNYQFYFFGEKHNSFQLSDAEFSLIKHLINIDVKNIFIEFPLNYQYLFDDIFYNQVKDTSIYKFNYLSKNNEFIKLLRNIYTYNHNEIISNKIRLITNDKIKLSDISNKDILFYYKKTNSKIRQDVKILKKIKKRSSDSLKLSKYLKFKNQIIINKKLHEEIIGTENYCRILNIIKGIEVYINSYNELGNFYYQSSIREEYIFNNLQNFILNNENVKFLSINGHFHIPMEKTEEWVNVKNWESLCYKITNKFPDKKTCSIYFLNRNDDSLSDKYFPYEKKIILENTIPGKYYLVKLDGENSPFRELSKKFQYIVVW